MCDSTTATSLAEADGSSSCNGKEVKIAQVEIWVKLHFKFIKTEEIISGTQEVTTLLSLRKSVSLNNQKQRQNRKLILP